MYEVLVFMCQIHNKTPPQAGLTWKNWYSIPLSVSRLFSIYMSTDLPFICVGG